MRIYVQSDKALHLSGQFQGYETRTAAYLEHMILWASLFYGRLQEEKCILVRMINLTRSKSRTNYLNPPKGLNDPFLFQFCRHL
jgi:hypothetical protein